MQQRWLDKFRQQRIARNQRRTHRPCPKHKYTRNPTMEVCTGCTRVFCRRCGHDCPRPAPPPPPPPTIHAKRSKKSEPPPPYVPSKELRPLWQAMKSLGALRIEPHPGEPGAYAVWFPAYHMDSMSVSNLDDKLRIPIDRDTPSPLQQLTRRATSVTGKNPKQTEWWIGVVLR